MMPKLRIMLVGVAVLLIAASSAFAQFQPPPDATEPSFEDVPALVPVLLFDESQLIDIPLSFECPADFAGYLPPRIQLDTVGAVLTISDLRALPDYRGSIIGMASPAAFINRVIAGPACSTGFVWWLVEVEGLVGWTPESSAATGAYWIESGDELFPVPPAEDEPMPVPPAEDELMPVPPAEEDPMPVPPEEEVIEKPLAEEVTDPDLRIDYTKFGITVVNIGEAEVRVGQLSFTSDSGTFNGVEWGIRGLGSGDCVQLYYSSSPRPALPNDCESAASWIARGFPNILFWQAEFTVTLAGAPVGTCRAAPNNDTDLVSCEIALD